MVTCTVGGTISGYCETGRTTSAPSPIRVRKTLTHRRQDGPIDEDVGETHGAAALFCVASGIAARGRR